MTERMAVTHTGAPSREARRHALRLIRMLGSRLDSIARSEMYKQDALRSASPARADVFSRMQADDRAHADWLRRQILRELGIPDR